MMKLEAREWREFFIGGDNGLFDIASSSSGIDKNKLIFVDENENIPYITRSDESNGMNLFINEAQNTKYHLDKGNAITIGLDTQTVFYQPHSFYTGQNIQVLRHEKLTKGIAEFLIPLIEVQMEKFNWGGNGATLGRLFKTKLMLPVTKELSPDWDFMENYSKSIFEAKEQKYMRYIKGVLDSLKYRKVLLLNEKDWREFSVESLGDIVSGKDIYNAKRINGDTPYVSATAKNNGIGYFVDNANITLEKNCLSVNRNGSVGYSFYHPYEGLYSNDCRKIRLKYKSDFVGFFIANQITKQKNKYNYGYKMGTSRVKRQKILLPINNKNEPDYAYMEQYIVNMKYKKIKQYLAFKGEREQ